ncbi:hypothetical protein CWI38_1551p0010 [Hamiltosporidium tvaerminnensis]|uniref:Uncharacterized protein n=1 Tax=Hamiltosporidium tvaerminnensis TaxID=1176355 RepID=A0A4Q9LQX8_9MICR|nr:hypothetical protein CWI38_1551p0010 [Hamiltosporidium tvaerminnensis]
MNQIFAKSRIDMCLEDDPLCENSQTGTIPSDRLRISEQKINDEEIMEREQMGQLTFPLKQQKTLIEDLTKLNTRGLVLEEECLKFLRG